MKRHEITLKLTLGLPPKELLANSRPHHMARANATKKYRHEAKIAALEAISKQPREFAALLPFRKAKAYPTFYWPDRRRRDHHNMMIALKPVWDGLQVERKRKAGSAAWIGAGLIRDDFDLEVAPHDVAVDRDRPRVEIYIELE